MLQIALHAQLVPDEETGETDLAVSAYLESSLDGETRVEPIPEAFSYHCLHRRRIPRRRRIGRG